MDGTERRRVATPLDVATSASARTAARRSSRRPAVVRRAVFAVAGVVGVLLSTVPAQAAPSTSAAAAALVAAKGHELEVITEQLNEAREVLAAQQTAAQTTGAQLEQATAALATAQNSVRSVARSAYTGSSLGSFQAMMSSNSADDFVSRMSTLQMVAGHQNDILETAAGANVAAAQASAAAQKAATDAKATFDAVAAKQKSLQDEVAGYQASFEKLSAQEKQAALAGQNEDRASRAVRTEPAAPSAPVVANSQAAQIAVNTAMAMRGKPYVWAASGPGSFDCSGLTAYAFRAAGISLPHSSALQSRMGQAVSRDQLQPGDLVFFYSPVSHVGIYIGNGQMVHAPTSGDVVKVSTLMSGFSGARRLTA
jgi:cell wall-associated NlpC family hydrolase